MTALPRQTLLHRRVEGSTRLVGKNARTVEGGVGISSLRLVIGRAVATATGFEGYCGTVAASPGSAFFVEAISVRFRFVSAGCHIRYWRACLKLSPVVGEQNCN